MESILIQTASGVIGGILAVVVSAIYHRIRIRRAIKAIETEELAHGGRLALQLRSYLPSLPRILDAIHYQMAPVSYL